MFKSLSVAMLATIMVLGMASVSSSANDPVGGQSSSQLNSMSPQSGSPSETGKTGIGSTSGTDANIDTGLKETTQTAPCASPGTVKPGKEPNTKADVGKHSAEDAAREALANVKKSDSAIESDTMRNPDAGRSAESSARLEAGSKPCPEPK